MSIRHLLAAALAALLAAPAGAATLTAPDPAPVLEGEGVTLSLTLAVDAGEALQGANLGYGLPPQLMPPTVVALQAPALLTSLPFGGGSFGLGVSFLSPGIVSDTFEISLPTPTAGTYDISFGGAVNVLDGSGALADRDVEAIVRVVVGEGAGTVVIPLPATAWLMLGGLGGLGLMARRRAA